MSDKKPDEKKQAAPAEGEGAAPAKKKGGIKIIGVVAALMLVEGAGLFLALKGGPAKAEATEVHPNLEEDHSQQKEEVVVVEDQFQNMQTGSVWIWDVAVYAEIKSVHSEQLQEILERRSGAVREGISQIFSRAQHAQLKEPERLTLNRQITAFLTKLLEEEVPTAEAGEHDKLIERILIPKCRGFPAS
jgi:flagellar basal body-associated protein FliL